MKRGDADLAVAVAHLWRVGGLIGVVFIVGALCPAVPGYLAVPVGAVLGLLLVRALDRYWDARWRARTEDHRDGR